MLKIYFGDFANGRLQRLKYLGYLLMLVVVIVGLMLTVMLAIGAGEYLTSGNFQQALEKLKGWLVGPALIIAVLVVLLILTAKLNIMAKRIRDIGLHGWWLVLALLLAAGGTSATYSEHAAGTICGIFSFLLLVLPSNTFGKKPGG